MAKFFGSKFSSNVSKQQQRDLVEAEKKRVAVEKKKIEDELADAELLDEKEAIEDLKRQTELHKKAYVAKKHEVKKRQA